MDRIGIFCRVSTAGQKQQGYSYEEQETSGITFAKSKNLPYEIYKEQASGRKKDRKEYLRFLKDVENGTTNILWLKALDRFSRTALDALTSFAILKEKKVRVFEDGKEIDLNDDNQRLLVLIKFGLAENEIGKTQKRTTEGKQAQKDRGAKAFSFLYGYASNEFDRDTGKRIYHIVPEEADVIRRAYQLWVLEGKSLSEINRVFIEQGVRAKTYGRKIKSKPETYNLIEVTSIRRILTHPEYIGLTKNSKGELIPSTRYEPILEDSNLWYRSQELLSQKSKIRPKYFKSSSKMLTGLIRCGECGSAYYAHLQNGRGGKRIYSYYHKFYTPSQKSCTIKPKFLLKERMEPVVDGVFRQLFLNSKRVLQLVSSIKSESIRNKESLLANVINIESSIAEVERKQKVFFDGMAEGLFSLEDVRENLSRLKIQADTLGNELSLNRALLDSEDQTLKESVDIYTSDVLGKYDEADDLGKREILMTILDIVITRESLNIQFAGGHEIRIVWADFPTLVDYFRLTSQPLEILVYEDGGLVKKLLQPMKAVDINDERDEGGDLADLDYHKIAVAFEEGRKALI